MTTKSIGIIMIILGIIMGIYTGFNYVTTEKVVDIGPVKINQQKNHPISWSPIVGGILLIGGIVIVASNKKGS